MSFFAFPYYKFRSSCTEFISYCVETNSAFNLVFHFSVDILRFLVISWWVNDTDKCKLLRDLLGRNVSQYQRSYIPICICSLLQALHTSCGYLDSFNTHCTHQRTVNSLACNKLEESGRKW